MRLKKISKGGAFAQLLQNGTRNDLIKKAAIKIGKKGINTGTDPENKFVIVQVGRDFGVSKRCTYAKRSDESKPSLGFTIALLRAIGLSEH